MLTKVYSYPGIASGEIQIKAGQALIRVPFTKGYLDKKLSKPATYTTSDPVMQMIIENSDLFGRRIFLKEKYGLDNSNAPVVDQEEEVEEETKEYPEVTTFEDAIKVLKAIPGVRVTSLKTPASAKKVAALNGVVFPNYNFE